MTFERAIESINMALLDGQCDEAERELLLLQPYTEAERRIVGHFKGIIAFHRGNVPAAKQQFELTICTHGDNVNLLRDLIVCQYHLQEMPSVRANLEILERRLSSMKLTQRSQFECELMLGKFLEEEARLAPAIDYYNNALARAANPNQRLRALIQKSRWHALYDPSHELSGLYRDLISVPRTGITKDLAIELEHGLMLIEMHLVGADHAWQRVQRLGDEIPEIDLRLMYFDYIEGMLLKDLQIPGHVREKLNSFRNLDPYERFIEKIIDSLPDTMTNILELTVLSSQLPWASYMRLLCLTANLEVHTMVQRELNRKIQLIVRALDPQSQNLWNQRLNQAMQSPEIRVEYSTRKRSVAVQGRNVDLTKKKMGMQLLEGLSRKPELTVDEAISLLWQSSFTPEHYHRLRMGIHRLNTLINKVTGLGKIIEVDSQIVRLRPEVKIRHVDEYFSSDLINI